MPLSKDSYFIKEHVGMFKAANNYDIYDPESQDIVMKCREPNLGIFTKLFRFTDYKRMTPFEIIITDADDNQLIRVERGTSIFLSHVRVYDENDKLIGSFKQKFFSIGGAFNVLDEEENIVCHLKGKWTTWEFKFLHGDRELATVTKKWAGIGKELFTSADNYALTIAEDISGESPIKKLIIAAVMCIDMVMKE